MTRLHMLVLGVLGSGLALACNKAEERPAQTASGEAPVVGMAPAAGARPASEQIAEARCAREQTCGNIGEGKTHLDSADCVRHIRADWKADLSARECPGGVNKTQLDECLEQVRTESCDNPFDTLSRLAACTQNQICIE